MKISRKQEYLNILSNELVPALGCTEPISVAYASAKAREVLGVFPDRINICCSGNIIKNVKGVMVPNSGGMKGIGAAAVLGVVGGNVDRELEVLDEITTEHIEKTKKLLEEDYFTCKLQENVANLFIVATVWSGEHYASVTVINRHTLITEIMLDGEIRFQKEVQSEKNITQENWKMSVKEILEFAEEIDLTLVNGLIEHQIRLNTRIAQEGLHKVYGSQIGRILLNDYEDDVRIRARAYAAAGSDARMGGCSLPVVINSGSGNQGMTVSLPVIEYAKEWKVTEDTLYRALLISNLISIHLKHYIGSLSAFCGAVTAGCGAGAAITYMAGGNYEQISNTIINTLANVGGIVCDGAKASCAAKIASSVDAAILAHHMSIKGLTFHSGEGIVQKDVEETIKGIGYIGRVGMRSTDVEILNVMLEQVNFDKV